MKTSKLLITVIIFSIVYGNANAQFYGLQRAVQRGVERAVEKKVEEKTEEIVSKEIDKSYDKAEEQRARSEAETKTNAKVANISDEIPEVGSSPYTPSESEFAFFAMKKGAVQVFASKDANGKITSQVRNTIKEITGSKNAFAIIYEGEVLDANGKPADKDNPIILNYRVVVKDGIMYLDMKGMFGGMEGLDGDMQMSGTVMKIPNNLSVGQSLDDAALNIKVGFMNLSVIITERKCLAIESVTVEAGTFRGYKVSQKASTTAMGSKTESTTLTWYAKGVGTVKTETYDKNGKLLSIQELIVNR